MAPCNLFPLLATEKKKQFKVCPTYGGLVQSKTHVSHQCFPGFSRCVLLWYGSWEFGGWEALSSAGGSLQVPDGHEQSQSQQRPECQESCWWKLQPESWWVPGLGSVMVWALRLERTGVPAQTVGQEECPRTQHFFFYFRLQLIGWGPPALGRAICFNKCANSDITLTQKHPHRPTWSNVWPTVWAPVARPSDT